MAEKAMTVEQISREYGYSKGFVRGACKRDPEQHRLPHVEAGASRAIIYIRPSVFEKWVAEEEAIA